MKKNNSLNVYTGSFLDKGNIRGFDEHCKSVWEVEKFDIIVGNPPYQEEGEVSKKTGKVNTYSIWDKFVIKSFDFLKEAGYLVFVHPSGWRSVDGSLKEIQKLFRSKKMQYLELHNTNDGHKTFGAWTTYDFYCIKNISSNGNKTTIKFQDSIIENVDISLLEFIPDGMFKEIQSLMAKEGEEKVELIQNSSYHLQKEYVSDTKNDTYVYPVVYTTTKDGSINFRWSSRNDKGHFNIPKVIWSNGGATTPVIDENGSYGLTQWAYAIVDEPKNLTNIKKAMESKKFNKLMAFTDGITGVGRHRYNRKAISTFRKDFWKEFLD